jgi:hypothetical protein
MPHASSSTSLILVLLFVAPLRSLYSQVPPAAQRGGSAFAAGVGISDFNVDWGEGRMLGATLWVDYYRSGGPPILNGLGLEIEARDISFDRSSTQPSNFREDTCVGGILYSWRRRKFRPYGKLLIGLAGSNFHSPNPNYNHDTRSMIAPGGGLDYRILHKLWVRAEYEYQTWPDFLRKNQTFHPQGFTFGTVYELGSPHRH